MSHTRTKKAGSVPVVPLLAALDHLSRTQRFAIETLAKRSGLGEDAILFHLITSGLYWTGLDASGEDSFETLLTAAVGKERYDELQREQLSEVCWAMNAGQAAADVEADERKAAHPEWFLADPDGEDSAEGAGA
jgi:hypothetical protein